jgi:glycosyltransferase involved in cell wall biosynthesis
MLRALDEKGGVAVYTHNILHELLQANAQHEYVLFYRHSRHIGQYAHIPTVKEVVIRGKNKAYWDQIAIPWACHQHKVDVLFHPKFTAPLLAPCPVVMTVHGADWFIPEQAKYYTPLDVRYMRTVMPLYLRKCAAVISVSERTTENFNRVFPLPPDKIKTIYFAPARHFQRVTDREQLNVVKEKYQLPDRFILTLTKRWGDGRKNLGQIFKAYAHYHQHTTTPHQLVVGGKNCHLFKLDYNIPDDGYGADILFPDWIDQQDLPAVYSLADCYLYPSNLEAFPIPLTEAMACGTPIITSNVNGLAEIAGDAAILVDPQDTKAIAAAICHIMSDTQLQKALSQKGLARAAQFSWDKCQQETLALLQCVAKKKGDSYVG